MSGSDMLSFRLWYSVYLLCWYKSTNTDSPSAAEDVLPVACVGSAHTIMKP
jgi:hypothetical protein